MLEFATILIMLMVAYAHWREGIFTAVTMCVNVFLAGLFTFNFWEPLADVFDPVFAKSFLAGYEDMLVMLLLFSVSLGVLRVLTNNLSTTQVEFQPLLQQFGGAAFGLITGYFVSGILLCMMQTLPWHESFMNFEPRRSDEPTLRSFLPPDRVWLALMHRAGAAAFSRTEDNTFDGDGNFELNYLRYRRYGENRNPLPYGKK